MERSLEHELESELEHEGELEGAFESELESEFELESESELEAESEFEGSLEGESELEAEAELGEQEQGEQFLSSLFGGGSGEGELESEAELGELGELGELEFEHEQGEQFLNFRKIGRGLGALARRAAPMLKRMARIAAPIAGKAVGGLLAGPAGATLGARLARLAAQRLREAELEGANELEAGELELGELELGEQELGEHEVAQELAEHEAHAEAMAHFAAFTESEHEAEAMAGAAASITLSPRDRRALRALVPNLVRGAGILTRVLRMRPETRSYSRVVPTIIRRTVRTLRREAANGRPITRRRAGQVMARQTRRVLGSPRYCNGVLRRNIRAAARVSRPPRLAVNGRRRRAF